MGTKIRCKECMIVVIEGNIKSIEKKKGGIKTIFDIGSEKPNGTILKNKSNNPNNWKALCSKCQIKLNKTPKCKLSAENMGLKPTLEPISEEK